MTSRRRRPLNAALRRVAHTILFPFIFTLGQLVLRLCRPLFAAGSTPRPWHAGDREGKPINVLIVAPHPDDEVIGAGGVAVLHSRYGDQVSVAVVTDGRASKAAQLSPTAMAQQRLKELKSALAILGIDDLVWLGLPETGWKTAAARSQLEPLLAASDVVYAPSCVDFHPDHLRVARLLGELVRAEQIVRVYETGVPLTPILVNVQADLSGVWARRRWALAAYSTQQAALRPIQRSAGYRATLYGRRAIEVFWEMSGEAYRRVMASGTWGWRTTPFRGFRPRPFGDLLAYFRGWQARQRLRRRADAQI